MKSSDKFFFDLPLCDVYSMTCAAFRLLYFGSEDGFFGSKRSNFVNLDTTAAIRIKLTHQSTKPLTDTYDYSLVYYRAELSDKLWHPKERHKHESIVNLTRRVKFNSEPSTTAKGVSLFQFPTVRPVKIAEYDEIVPQDNYVPVTYIDKLHNNFKGFLMRTEKDYPLVRNIFECMDLTLESKREMNHPSPKSPDVIIYTVKEEFF